MDKFVIIGGSEPTAANVPRLFAKEVIDRIATGVATTVDGLSVVLPAGKLKAGRILRITAFGTIVGGNAAKAVKLFIDDAVVATCTLLATAVGNFKAEFLVFEHTDLAHQLIAGLLQCATNAGATTSVAADVQTDTTNFGSADRTVKLQFYSNNAGDTITGKVAMIELLPGETV